MEAHRVGVAALAVPASVMAALTDIVEHVARNTRPALNPAPVVEFDVRLPRMPGYGLSLQIAQNARGTPGHPARPRWQSSVEITGVTPGVGRVSPQHALVRAGDFIVRVNGERRY